MFTIIELFDRAFQLLTILVVVRVFLSWVPSIDYGHPVISFIVRVTDPVLQPVRRLLPPVGGLDLSPIIAIFLLQLAQRMLHQILVSILYTG